MVHRGRDQHVAVHVVQAAARPLLLGLRPRLLGRHPTAALHHPRGFQCLDQPQGLHHHDLPDVGDHGRAPELGPLLAVAPHHARGGRPEVDQIRPDLHLRRLQRSHHRYRASSCESPSFCSPCDCELLATAVLVIVCWKR